MALVNSGISLLITPFIPLHHRASSARRTVYQYCGLFTVVGGVGLFLAPANMLWLACCYARRSRASAAA